MPCPALPDIYLEHFALLVEGNTHSPWGLNLQQYFTLFVMPSMHLCMVSYNYNYLQFGYTSWTFKQCFQGKTLLPMWSFFVIQGR